MPIPVHADEFTEYVLKSERADDGSPLPGAAVFFIGSISAVDFSNLMKKTAAMFANPENPNEQDYGLVNEWLLKGLRGWSWRSPKTGADIPFKADVQTLSLLPFYAALELMAEIQRANTLSKADSKNSVSE